jgi:predicted small metal-binding protein
MKQSLKQISCDPECGFKVQSHDVGEVKEYAMSHVKNVHKMEVSERDMEKRMTDV